MFTRLVVSFIACMLVSTAHSSELDEEPARCYATVRPNGAEFYLENLYDVSDWRWNRSETPDNRLEYQWAVFLSDYDDYDPCAEGERGFGVTRFKWGDLAERTGTLHELMREAQADAWTRFHETDRTRHIGFEEGEVRGGIIEDHWVLIGILDSSTLQFLFADRPKRARFVAFLPERLGYDCWADIEYTDEPFNIPPNEALERPR